MKNEVLAVVVLGSVLAASGQDQKRETKLFTENTSHSFGTVARGPVLPWKFTIHNKSSMDFQVSDPIRVSCGCVKAVATPTVIKAGETGSIDIAMDTRRFKGSKSVTIHATLLSLTGGQQFTTTASFNVSATSLADVVFSPGEADFGVTPKGQRQTMAIDVEYTGRNSNWQIVGMGETKAPVDVKVEEVYRSRGIITSSKVRYRLQVTLNPDSAVGAQSWEIPMMTNDPVSSVLSVLVKATVDAPLMVAPALLSLGNVKVGEVTRKKVLVRGSKPFRILSVEGNNADVSVELPSTSARVQLVQIVYRPSRIGDVQTTLLFKTDLDVGGTAKVKLSGSSQSP